MAEYKVEDYFATAGGFAINLAVVDQTARLALTGIPTNFVVEEVGTGNTTSPTMKVWKYNGGGISNNANWTDVTASADCTAAIQAAVNALKLNGKGGTILFPSGICRMAAGGKVSEDLGASGSQQGMFILKGTGDSAIRFLGTNDVRLQFFNSQTIICEKLVFLGDLTSLTSTEASIAHLSFGGDISIVKECLFYGLGLAHGTAKGILWMSNQCVLEKCQFRGTWGNLDPVVYATAIDSFVARDVRCIDYGVYGTTSYAKGGSTGLNWIKVVNTGSTNQIPGSKFLCEDCTFDEGADVAVSVTDFEWAVVRASNVNIPGRAHGPEFIRVHNVEVDNSNFGYTSFSGIVGLYVEDVDTARFRNIRFFSPAGETSADTLSIQGTTRKVIIDNCSRGLATRLPWILQNDADAEIIVDGVRTKGGLTQIG